MSNPDLISSYFESTPSNPTAVRLVRGDSEVVQRVLSRLAALGLPSTRGEVLRIAVREGLDVLLTRLDAAEASR